MLLIPYDADYPLTAPTLPTPVFYPPYCLIVLGLFPSLFDTFGLFPLSLTIPPLIPIMAD